jgi:hypothetical protein
MTELARRLLGSLQRPGPAGRTPPAAMPVQIRLPASVAPEVARGLPAALTGPLGALAAELGFTRAPEIEVHGPGGADHLAVSIDGRPVADLPGDRLGPGADLTGVILSRALRRLPLLAGSAVGEHSTAAYLAGIGCRAPDGRAAGSFDVERAERLIDERADERIVLEVPAATMRRLGPDDVRAVERLREQEFRGWGIVYPDVRVVLTGEPPGTVRMRINDVTLPASDLGPDAGWRDVVAFLGRELADRRHWFVRMRDVVRVMDEDLAYSYPDLVAVAEANYSRAQVTACVREMLRSGRRARNLLRILWLLIEAGGSSAGADVLRMSESPLLPKARRRPTADSDPMVQATRVRKLAAEEDWRTGGYRLPRRAVRLPPEIEDRLAGLTAERELSALADAEWAAVRAVTGRPDAQRLYTRTVAAVGPVRDAVQAVENRPRVRASHELPPDIDVDALPILTRPGDR